MKFRPIGPYIGLSISHIVTTSIPFRTSALPDISILEISWVVPPVGTTIVIISSFSLTFQLIIHN
jgi:hypothetical protein